MEVAVRCSSLLPKSLHAIKGSRRTLLAVLLATGLLAGAGAKPVAAQTVTLTGQVIDAETEEPLAGANVFLDGTLKGAATNEDGRFHIEGVSPGSYRLVASMVGYQTKQRKTLLSEGGAQSFDFELNPDVLPLKGITVEEDRSTWLNRLERFEEYFFGNVRNADDCELLNPEVLRFTIEDGTLKAFADEPLEVINRALGYRIIYQLRGFEASEERIRQVLLGQFREMEAKSQEQRRGWAEAREQAYRGSFQHFVRSLSKNTFDEEGFRVYTTLRRLYYYGDNPDRHLDGVSAIQSADEISLLLESLNILVLNFSANLLRVEYLREQESKTYRQTKLSEETREESDRQLSWIELPQKKALVDVRSGLSFQTYEPMLHGYWGWAERVPNALPREYRSGD